MSSKPENVSSEAVPQSGEIEYRSSKFSIGFHLLLPVAGLGLIIFGRRHILDKILLQLDRKCLTVLCPSFIKRENVLKWACSRLPPTWSSHSVETLSGGIKELWTDGSLLCTLINTAIPGACPNPHRHWKQSPTHAQALAFKYLGITPIFTNEDLTRKLTLRLERKFIRYLSEIQQLVNRISENAENERKVSSRYIVRGMGLFSGEQNKKTTFYIYLNEHNDEDDVEGTIIIQIKGPYGTYGEAVTPKLINKKRKIRNKRKQERRPSIQFIENLMQSNTWNFTRTQKKYINEGIEIVTEIENDRIKVTYTPTNYGMYEINMISRGELLKGCPFSVHIFINEFGQNAEVEKENVQKKKTIRKSTRTNMLADLPERVEIKQKTSEIKPTFKFNEVVDEITKNGLVYRNILGHTPENETTNLEISAGIENTKENHLSVSGINDMNIPDFDTKKDDDIILHYQNLDDSKVREFNKFIKSNENINKGVKPTEDSTESFSSSSNEISETIFVDKKITEDKSSKHVTDNVKINNTISATIFANKNLINESEKTQLENSFVFEPKYVNTVNINKIKIPELFRDNQVNNCSCYLDDKYFKNILNESNKVTRRFSNIKTYNELNNNKHKSYNNVNAVEVDKNKTTTYSNQNKDTSPICPQHIVPEVEIIPKTVEEKRKVFAQRSLGRAFSSKISSFSSENEQESIDKDYETQGLGVLNIVNNLEESINNPSAETWSLCSTLSLPNLSLESEYSYVISIKDKKDFWENVSSHSSSSVSTKSLSPKKENTTSELERSKLIWKKSFNNTCNKVILPENVYKSADDITCPYEDYSKYKSVDDSLDECAVLSIDERKRLLLNEFYEKENLIKKTQRKKISVKDQMVSKNNEAKNILENKNPDEYFTPLSEKIKKYSSALELSPNTSKELIPNLRTTGTTPDIRKKPEALITQKKTVHSQFKKAINYFKKLETQSHDKPIKPTKKLNSQNNLQSHLGGSLNIPSVSQKFFINNLYQDVFGNKKSNFRGTPNKSALVEALATFSRNPKRSNDNEDDIKFEIFKRFGKSRKRKSLKSVFDIHY